MYFKGDVIITDPCYIIREGKNKPLFQNYLSMEIASKPFVNFTEEEKLLYEQYEKDLEQWEEENPDDWETCQYGEYMEALGFTNYLTSDTEYGDWSCTTYEEDTNKKLGNFCADAGMVSVFLLDEILKYNPNFDYHINNPHCATWIKDFEGDITIIHREYSYYDDEDETFRRTDEEVSVVGKGSINFYTSQTGI